MLTRTVPTFLLVITLVAVGTGCSKGKPKEKSSDTASLQGSTATSSSPSSPALPLGRPPLPQTPLRATAQDGLLLEATFIHSPDPGAKLVILLHRWAGSREEWSPLLDLLARADPAPHLLALDLRGHGGSTRYAAPAGVTKTKEKTIVWSRLSASDFAVMVSDVDVARRAVEQELGSPADVAIVGSDLGATIGAMVASKDAKKNGGKDSRVVALGLVSPGAVLHGLDVYHPFADVRHESTFIASASEDTISVDPLASLTKMATNGTVLRYPSEAHSAEFLGREHPEFWQDLKEWILTKAFSGETAPLDSGASNH